MQNIYFQMSRSLVKKIISGICNRRSLVKKRDYHQQRITNVEIQQRRAELFDKEAKRQNALITDVDKIEVQYLGLPDKCTLIMNKDLSTPYNCAQHINKNIIGQAVLAEVDGEPWDMFRPLTDNCQIKFLHFKEDDPFYVNKAFWRTLSLMLGSVVEVAFKNDVDVHLCSFPSPNIRSGSFVYDVELSLDEWRPKRDELRVFSAEMVRLALSNKPIYRLEMDAKVALEIFADNKFKTSQIPSMASDSKSGNNVVVYRIGNFFDLSRGPMIGHTGHVGKCTISAALPIETDIGPMYRFQGVALPKDFRLSHYAYNVLEERARKLNSGRNPYISQGEQIAAAENISSG